MWVSVMDDLPRIGIFAHFTVKEIVLTDRTFFERGGGQDGFECRARFETIGHRAIAPLLSRFFCVTVGVERWEVRQR
jgi:hypothetical protein